MHALKLFGLGACLLKRRSCLRLRAASIVAYLPKHGTLRWVVTRNRHGNVEVLAPNQLYNNLTTTVLRRLAACQCRVNQALVRHVALVLIAFVVL